MINGLDSLDNRDKTLLFFALLLDGHEALAYLENDLEFVSKLKDPLMRMAELQADIRIPYISSLLRKSLSELA